jgi:hypothetical protein
MRKGVSFNPRWVNNEPAWDIRLINGDIHRGVTESDISRISSRHVDVVREQDIQDYAKHYLSKRKS